MLKFPTKKNEAIYPPAISVPVDVASLIGYTNSQPNSTQLGMIGYKENPHKPLKSIKSQRFSK